MRNLGGLQCCKGIWGMHLLLHTFKYILGYSCTSLSPMYVYHFLFHFAFFLSTLMLKISCEVVFSFCFILVNCTQWVLNWQPHPPSLVPDKMTFLVHFILKFSVSSPPTPCLETGSVPTNCVSLFWKI